MARPSVISFEDVKQAVAALKNSGKRITPYQIRLHLGRGSEAKITYFLKGMDDTNTDFSADDPLTNRLHALIRPLVLEINEQVEEQLRMEKAHLQQTLEQARAANQQQQETIQALELAQDQSASQAEKQSALIAEQADRIQSLQDQLRSAHNDIAMQREKQASRDALLKQYKEEQQRSDTQHQHHVTQLQKEHAEEQARFNASFEQLNQLVHSQAAQLQYSQQEQQRTREEQQQCQQQWEQLNVTYEQLQRSSEEQARIRDDLLNNHKAQLDEERARLNHELAKAEDEKNALKHDKQQLQKDMETLMGLVRTLSQPGPEGTSGEDANDGSSNT